MLVDRFRSARQAQPARTPFPWVTPTSRGLSPAVLTNSHGAPRERNSQIEATRRLALSNLIQPAQTCTPPTELSDSNNTPLSRIHENTYCDERKCRGAERARRPAEAKRHAEVRGSWCVDQCKVCSIPTKLQPPTKADTKNSALIDSAPVEFPNKSRRVRWRKFFRARHKVV